MKTTLFLLLSLPFILFAQGDDYCPCQETDPDFADIFDFTSSVETETTIVVMEEPTSSTLWVKMEEPDVVELDIFDEEEPIIEIQEKDNLLDEIEDDEGDIEMEGAVSNGRAKIKKRKKLFKKKLKKRKKHKKYRGGCPAF